MWVRDESCAHTVEIKNKSYITNRSCSGFSRGLPAFLEERCLNKISALARLLGSANKAPVLQLV